MRPETSRMTRRHFIGAGASLPLFSIATGAPAANNAPLRVGLVGCGGRGTGAARDALLAGPNIELIAIGDILKMQVDGCLSRLAKFRDDEGRPLAGLKVTPEKCFTGLAAYKSVIDSGIDYVLLCTPPGFRPMHIEYAVARGIHIFAEKPCATDAPGVRRILALEPEMKRKGIGLLSGFNGRHAFHYVDMVNALKEGDIGTIISMHAYFNTGDIWYRERPDGMSLPEYHFYNWFHVDWLCGDHIVEQHVHNLDRCNWIMGDHPIKAYGMGGRQYHTDRGGNIYDHFAVEFEYPNGVRMTSMCRQIKGTDARVGEEIIGTKGTASTIGRNAAITGEKSRVFKEHPGQQESHQQEHTDFIGALRRGEITNDTRFLCDSTLTAIMGRESAYTGKVVAWDEIMASELSLTPANIAAWDGSIRPVPKPGMARA